MKTVSKVTLLLDESFDAQFKQLQCVVLDLHNAFAQIEAEIVARLEALEKHFEYYEE